MPANDDITAALAAVCDHLDRVLAALAEHPALAGELGDRLRAARTGADRARTLLAGHGAGAAPAAPARPRVLVIDDEPMLTGVLQAMLSETYDVTVMNDARAARAAVAGGARYDAIICDLMMPGLSGSALHRELLALAPEQARRMIFMTGGAYTAEARQFLDGSGVLHLQKPFVPDALQRALAAVTGRS